MTVAAGFRCRDGILLCADSQETITGYLKTDKRKIVTHFTDNFVVGIAGAGTSDYIETAVAQVFQTIPPDAADLAAILKGLKAALLEFFKSSLQPWAAHPEQDRPTVELLVGITHKNGSSGLYHYSGTSINSIHGAKTIGAGVLLANSLASTYWNSTYHLVHTASLATYILWKVKKGVDTCGGRTDMIMLRPGAECAFVGTDEVERLERKQQAIEIKSNNRLTDRLAHLNLDWPRGWINNRGYVEE
jgi:hypothetical protein